MVMEERSADTANRVEEVHLGNGHKHGRSEDSSSKTVNLGVETGQQDLLSNKGQRWVFEKCVNFSAVDSPSLKEVMTVSGGQMGNNIVDSQEINGCMIQEELKEVQDSVKSFHMQVQILNQLEIYKLGRGSFNETCQADQISGISPAEWWAQKASQYPELQSFAIKILSQTCEGASRYKLKRSLAEKLLLIQGMSHSEKQHLEDFAFVHYNLHLQSQTK